MLLLDVQVFILKIISKRNKGTNDEITSILLTF